MNQEIYRPKSQADKLKALMEATSIQESSSGNAKEGMAKTPSSPDAPEEKQDFSSIHSQNHMSVGIWFCEENMLNKEEKEKLFSKIKRIEEKESAQKNGKEKKEAFMLESDLSSFFGEPSPEEQEALFNEIEEASLGDQPLIYQIGEGITAVSVKLIHVSDAVVLVVKPTRDHLEQVDKVMSFMKSKKSKKTYFVVAEWDEENYDTHQASIISQSMCQYFQLKHQESVVLMGHYVYEGEQEEKQIKKIYLNSKITTDPQTNNLSLTEKIKVLKGW